MFRDAYRLGHPVDTRAECDAADEAYHQHRAATMGAACLDLAQELVEVTDRYPEQWRSDDMDRITELHGALTEALRMAQEIKP
jgi:hypothetical protein